MQQERWPAMLGLVLNRVVQGVHCSLKTEMKKKKETDRMQEELLKHFYIN